MVWSERNEQRLAVLDQDAEAIVRTHLRDGKVAAWYEDVAQAFDEIGRMDLAIEWAWRANEFDCGQQNQKAGNYWCRLLAEHRPQELLPARLTMFRRWPSSSTAAALHLDAGQAWQEHAHEVSFLLSSRPRDAVLFVLLTLEDAQAA